MTRTSPRPHAPQLLLATIGAALCLASCTRLRSPQELLQGPNPEETARAIARAEDLFQRYCSICHGETGTGDGQYFASDLQPTPADLTRAGPAALGAEDLERWIRDGSAGFGRSPLCPPWGYTFTKDDIAILAQYVLSLRQTPSQANDRDQAEAPDADAP